MAVPKPSLHARDHRPGGPDAIPSLTLSPVTVPNVRELRWFVYNYSSDNGVGTANGAVSGVFKAVPWFPVPSPGIASFLTNDVPTGPNYDTVLYDSSTASPLPGDYFEEQTVSGVTYPSAGTANSTLYLTTVSAQFFTAPGSCDVAIYARAPEDVAFINQGYVKYVAGFNTPQVTWSGIQRRPQTRVSVVQNSGSTLAYDAQIWVARLSPTFGTAFTVADAT